VPSVLFGALGAWTSSNGLPNAGLGLASAAVVTTLLLVSWVEQHARRLRAARPSTNRPDLAWLPAAVVSALLAVPTLFFVYGDRRIERLRVPVASGPYAGLRTTLPRGQLLEEIAYELHRLEAPGRRLLVYNRFPAGYLLTEMRPALPFGWLLRDEDRRETYAEAYAERARPDDVVLVMKRSGIGPDDPLHAVVEHLHGRVLDRPTWALFAGPRSPSRAADARPPAARR
jgi:hypothetical protein